MPITKENLTFKPRMQVINEDQIQKIYSTALDILETVGVQITHKQAVELLESHGARVEGKIVKIPSYMVQNAVASVPKRLPLGNREGSRAFVVEDDNAFFGPSLDCVYWRDPVTGDRVRYESKHVKPAAQLVESLDHLDWQMVIGMANDLSETIADKVVIRQALEHCRKPLVFCCNDTYSVEQTYEMALLMADSKAAFEENPSIIHYSEPISPLVYYDPAIEKLMLCAEKKIPLINFPALQIGGSAPATMAGAIAQGVAESLSGLVLHQLVNPGAPFICGAFMTVLDMRTTIFSYGAVELSLMVSAWSQIAQYLKIPFFGTAGATDSKFNDCQAGAEAAWEILCGALSGQGLVHDCGAWMDHGNTVCLQFMVLVDELVGWAQKFMKGIDVNQETLALDVIQELGPGRDFIAHAHTARHFREVLYSNIFERQPYDRWKEAGSMSFEQRLQRLTLKKMEKEPTPWKDDIIRELDKIQASWK